VVDLIGSGSVTSNPPGLACTTVRCTGTFETGTQVTLDAAPASDHRFVSWSAPCPVAASCAVTVDRPYSITLTLEPKVDPNGLTPEVNAFVPDTLLATMQMLGMPIHRGATPPNIEGIYHGAPIILVGSTVAGDVPGARMLDYDFAFSEQDNERLTVAVDYVNGPDRGVGLGGFIVGSDSTFTVFARLRSQAFGDSSLNVQVLSGRLRPQGIADLYVAGFMLDNYGNPQGFWIPNGTGRVGRDDDTFSERIPGLPQPDPWRTGRYAARSGLLSDLFRIPGNLQAGGSPW
jgi:hypothetical protein